MAHDRGEGREWGGWTRAGTVGLAVVGLAAAFLPVAAQQETYVREDLRCLTDRAEDCLPAPLSRSEPHGAICATCHDMYEQATPAEAAGTCATAECHPDAESLTPLHRGLEPGVLADCIRCHDPHDARIPRGGASCSVCHTGGVRYDEPRSEARHPLPEEPVDVPVLFSHDRHASLACTSCHPAGRAHGARTVGAVDDCRSCHHNQPRAAACQDCHGDEAASYRVVQVTRTVPIEVGSLRAPERALTFDHGAHERFQCETCHTQGLELSAAGTDCQACHEAHHEPQSDCRSCHAAPAEGVHDRDVHLGCGGAGCHETAERTLLQVPRTRAYCLVCHRDLADHKPDGNCADCHLLAEPRPVDG